VRGDHWSGSGVAQALTTGSVMKTGLSVGQHTEKIALNAQDGSVSYYQTKEK